jgi:hypothetical protein
MTRRKVYEHKNPEYRAESVGKCRLLTGEPQRQHHAIQERGLTEEVST